MRDPVTRICALDVVERPFMLSRWHLGHIYLVISVHCCGLIPLIHLATQAMSLFIEVSNGFTEGGSALVALRGDFLELGMDLTFALDVQIK